MRAIRMNIEIVDAAFSGKPKASAGRVPTEMRNEERRTRTENEE